MGLGLGLGLDGGKNSWNAIFCVFKVAISY